MSITYRMLPVDEWDRLQEVYSRFFPERPFPNPEASSAAVAELDGKIVGFWFLSLCAHAEPVAIDPVDGKEVNLYSLQNTLMKTFTDNGCSGMEYYICTADPRLGEILEGSGYQPVGVMFSNRVP